VVLWFQQQPMALDEEGIQWLVHQWNTFPMGTTFNGLCSSAQNNSWTGLI
jgi:hypothetical protein